CHPFQLRPPRRSTLFPYTTLFRSKLADSPFHEQSRLRCVKRPRLPSVESAHDQQVHGRAKRRLDSKSSLRSCHHSCVSPRDHTKDRKSTRLNSSHVAISYAVFCLK